MKSVSLIWFLVSQTIYGVGSYAVMSALFQLRVRKHLWKIVVIAVLTSIINYFVYFNKGTELAFIVPIIGILITFLYLTAIVKVPTLWAFVVTVLGGVVIPLVVQLGIIYSSFGLFMPSALKEHIWRNYALDITSGLIFSLVAVLLTSRGWSFSFDFEKIRFKWERYTVITISFLAAICLPVSIAFTDLTFNLNLAYLSISSFLVFIFLLGYAFKKEQAEIKFLKPNEEVKENV